MSADLILVLALLLATILMFAANRPRMDVVAIIAMTALPLTGIISVTEALAGFSDPNVILIAALFVLGEGLVRTGVARRLGDFLVQRAGRDESRLIAFLMAIVAGTGAFMSSTAVVAIFIPVVLRIAQNAGLSPRRLMMPLSVAGLISGMMTLIATAPNLVVHSELVRAGHRGFHFFAFLPFGIPVLAVAILWMLYARRWLAPDATATPVEQERPRITQLIDEYGLETREHRLRIGLGSALAGKRLDELDLRASRGVTIIAIERRRRFARQVIHPTAETELRVGDILFLHVMGPDFDIDSFSDRNRLRRLPWTGRYFADLAQEIGMAELIVPPASVLVGQTVVEAAFRTRYDLAVIGHKRGTRVETGAIAERKLSAGDTLLVVGPWRAIRRLQAEHRDLVLLNTPAELDEAVAVPGRAPYAVLTLALVVGLMIFGVIPNVLAALLGCLLLGVFGCIDMNSAYRSIHWQTLLVIVGMLPFSLALQATGGTDLAAAWLSGVIDDAGPRTALAAIFVLTTVMGLFISNTATAVLVAPIALAIANEMGLSPYPFAMTVALAASASFMTPVSSPVNTLVVGPGGYRFFDFVKVGVPMALFTLAITVLLVPLVFPF